jgi:polyhydroxyalkanoate synthesis regulator phasin
MKRTEHRRQKSEVRRQGTEVRNNKLVTRYSLLVAITLLTAYCLLLTGQAGAQNVNPTKDPSYFTAINHIDISGANTYRAVTAGIAKISREQTPEGVEYTYTPFEIAGIVAGQKEPALFGFAPVTLKVDAKTRSLTSEEPLLTGLLDLINPYLQKEIKLRQPGDTWQATISIGRGDKYLPENITVTFEMKTVLAPDGREFQQVTYHSDAFTFDAFGEGGGQVEAHFTGFNTNDPLKNTAVHAGWSFYAIRTMKDGTSDVFNHWIASYKSDSIGFPLIPFDIYGERPFPLEEVEITSDPNPPQWAAQALGISQIAWIRAELETGQITNPVIEAAAIGTVVVWIGGKIKVAGVIIATGITKVKTATTVVKYKVKEGVRIGGTKIKKIADDIGAWIRKAGDTTARAAKRMGEEVVKVGKEVADEAVRVGEEVVKVGKKMADEAVEVLRRVPEQVLRVAQEVGKEVVKKRSLEEMRKRVDAIPAPGKIMWAGPDRAMGTAAFIPSILPISSFFRTIPEGGHYRLDISGSYDRRGVLPGENPTLRSRDSVFYFRHSAPLGGLGTLYGISRGHILRDPANPSLVHPGRLWEGINKGLIEAGPRKFWYYGRLSGSYTNPIFNNTISPVNTSGTFSAGVTGLFWDGSRPFWEQVIKITPTLPPGFVSPIPVIKVPITALAIRTFDISGSGTLTLDSALTTAVGSMPITASGWGREQTPGSGLWDVNLAGSWTATTPITNIEGIRGGISYSTTIGTSGSLNVVDGMVMAIDSNTAIVSAGIMGSGMINPNTVVGGGMVGKMEGSTSGTFEGKAIGDFNPPPAP